MPVIEVRELTKRYGATRAVDGLSFTVPPGLVTGFLGPNGAGKSTTMRVVLGLDRPTSGEALIGGSRYADLPRPLHRVGALLDAGDAHPGRAARDHLRVLARSNGIGDRRVDELLERVGLGSVAGRRVGALSLGMRQRLGVAAALLGDPEVLLFDEPVNGLDPEGIRWIRGLMRGLAAEGRAVLVSSHLMGEMALTADRVVVVGRGRLVLEGPVSELVGRARREVLVRAPEPGGLVAALERAGGEVVAEGERWVVRGLDAPAVAGIAHAEGVLLHELTPRGASLEEAYLELTESVVRHRAEGVAA
ncbi:export ABC transporter ATP-binding protein [Actinosynnema pretiosum]|uniref:Export ABC transporter ATP-binding protein n=1 Tax=Actinosynnema pretiosum TaxID=42197 RepID=A0A290Z489_9PSEU|nr:export ABC transporter ATP-binding protein [Actinosynnema pretiosum]